MDVVFEYGEVSLSSKQFRKIGSVSAEFFAVHGLLHKRAMRIHCQYHLGAATIEQKRIQLAFKRTLCILEAFIFTGHKKDAHILLLRGGEDKRKVIRGKAKALFLFFQ